MGDNESHLQAINKVSLLVQICYMGTQEEKQILLKIIESLYDLHLLNVVGKP